MKDITGVEHPYGPIHSEFIYCCPSCSNRICVPYSFNCNDPLPTWEYHCTNCEANKNFLLHRESLMKTEPKHDPVNHPKHYIKGGIETIDVIEAFELNFQLANCCKYILRHGDKNGLEDLKKARWYLDREISKQEEDLKNK